MRQATQRHLHDVHKALLHLHKVLLDIERVVYEREHGRVTAGELLKLVIDHRQFAWLHAISERVVRIDELFDGDEPTAENDARWLLSDTRGLLIPAEDGAGFAGHYYRALQRDPAAVLAHREAVRVIEMAVKGVEVGED